MSTFASCVKPKGCNRGLGSRRWVAPCVEWVGRSAESRNLAGM